MKTATQLPQKVQNFQRIPTTFFTSEISSCNESRFALRTKTIENKRRHTKPKKLPDRKWNISVKKNIKNTAKHNTGIQTRREPMAKFGGNPTKILGGVRITVMGDGPFDVNNRRSHLHFRDLSL